MQLRQQAAAGAHRLGLAAPPPFRAAVRGIRRREQQQSRLAVVQQQQPAQTAAATPPPRILLPGIDDEIALTPQPTAAGFMGDSEPATPWVRPPERTITGPSIRDSGTLRPGPEWFPAWMKYRRREDNYVFWQDKFLRCSLEIPGESRGFRGWRPPPAPADAQQRCIETAAGVDGKQQEQARRRASAWRAPRSPTPPYPQRTVTAHRGREALDRLLQPLVAGGGVQVLRGAPRPALRVVHGLAHRDAARVRAPQGGGAVAGQDRCRHRGPGRAAAHHRSSRHP